jgi:hypothetical protein
MKLMTDEQVYNYKNENPAIPWRSLQHPTPACFDSSGSYGVRAQGDTRGGGASLANWANSHWYDSVMTEEQRLAYNIQQLGENGAAAFELKYQASTSQSER